MRIFQNVIRINISSAAPHHPQKTPMNPSLLLNNMPNNQFRLTACSTVAAFVCCSSKSCLERSRCCASRSANRWQPVNFWVGEDSGEESGEAVETAGFSELLSKGTPDSEKKSLSGIIIHNISLFHLHRLCIFYVVIFNLIDCRYQHTLDDVQRNSQSAKEALRNTQTHPNSSPFNIRSHPGMAQQLFKKKNNIKTTGFLSISKPFLSFSVFFSKGFPSYGAAKHRQLCQGIPNSAHDDANSVCPSSKGSQRLGFRLPGLKWIETHRKLLEIERLIKQKIHEFFPPKNQNLRFY